MMIKNKQEELSLDQWNLSDLKRKKHLIKFRFNKYLLAQ